MKLKDLKYFKLKVIKPTSTRSCTFVSSTGLARSHGDSEDRVCAQAALVLSSVELQHQVVDGSLQKYSCIIQIVSHYKNGTLVLYLLWVVTIYVF